MATESTYISFEVKNRLAIEKLKELRQHLVPVDEVIEDLILRVDSKFYISMFTDN